MGCPGSGPLPQLLQQLHMFLSADGARDAPGKEVPFTSALEDGLPRPFFSQRADIFAMLPEYPHPAPSFVLS